MFDLEFETGAKVRMRYAPGAKALPTVLVVPGWGSDVLGSSTYGAVAESLLSAGYHCCLLVFRRWHGPTRHTGKATWHDHLQDIKKAYAWLTDNERVDATRMCGFGTSHGGFLLAKLLNELPMQLLALRAPALYADDRIPDARSPEYMEDAEYWEWCSSVRAREDSSVLNAINTYTGKLLIVVSECDEQVPRTVMQSYGLAASEARLVEEVVIPGAFHGLSGKPREDFLDIMKQWFIEQYPSST